MGRVRDTARASNHVLETAVKIASRDGLSGLTIGLLAKAVGMSKSGIFAQVSSKDNLKLMVLKKAAEDFTDKVFRRSFKEGRGEPRVRAIFENWLAYLQDSTFLPGGNILIASALELDDRPGPHRNFIQETKKALVANLEKAARLSVNEGHFRQDLNCEQFAYDFYSNVLGYHHCQRVLENPKAGDFVRYSFENLLNLSKKETGNGAHT